jgi:O-antigen/teichoic acid export membrane protein
MRWIVGGGETCATRQWASCGVSLNRLWAEWELIRSSSLARNAAWLTAGQCTGYLLQGIYFVILARLLGALEYGIFAGAFAFVNLVARYGTVGTGTVLLRYVSIDRSKFALYWGNTLLVTAAGGLLMTVILQFAGRHFLNPASAAIVLFASLANCFGTQVTTCASQVFQALEEMRITALLTLLMNLLRTVAAAVLLLVLHRITAWQWALVSLVVSLVGAALAVIVIALRSGRPQVSLSLMRRRLLEGAGYAFASSTTSAYNDLDKAMLSHYDMNAANGLYTLAYRAIDIATMPVYSLAAAAMPQLFRNGAGGLQHAAALALRLLKRSLLLSLVAASGLLLLAPLLPRFAGHSFSEAAVALRWLCLIPVLRGVHETAGSALTGAGLQRYRIGSQSTAVVLNLLLNLWLIPLYSWRGAALSSLLTDGALGAMNWTILRVLILRLRKRELCDPRLLEVNRP